MESLRPIDCLFSAQPLKPASPAMAPALSGAPCRGPIANVVPEMDRYGIDRVLLTPCAVEANRCDRQYLCEEAMLSDLLQQVSRQPQRVSALVGFNPYDIADSLRRLQQAISDYDLKGLYVSSGTVPLLDRRMYPAYAKCAELNVPVMFYADHSLAWTNEWPMLQEVGMIAADFPDLRVVAAFGCWPPLDEIWHLLERHDNMFFALDANPRRDLVARVANFLNGEPGRSHCLWGSNGCCWSEAVPRLNQLPLHAAVRECFARTNAIAVFDLHQQKPPQVEADLILTGE